MKSSVVVSFLLCFLCLLLCNKGGFALPPLCPLPPYDDDVHLNCDVERFDFTSTRKSPLPSLSSSSSSSSSFSGSRLLQVVEYNIDRNGFGGDGFNENGTGPIVSLLQNSSLVPAADVLVLIEVARGCKSYGGIDYNGARDIAEQLGMNMVYAVEYVEIEESDDSNECSIGNAILSVFPIDNIQQLRFEAQCCRYGGRYGGRIDLVVDVVLPHSLPIRVHGAHLESGQSNVEMVLQSLVVREQQAAEMAMFPRSTESVTCALIVGDLNSPLPKLDPTIIRLEKEGFTNAHADCAILPSNGSGGSDTVAKCHRELIQLDYLLSSSPVELILPGYCTSDGCAGASDHVPYWASYKY